MPLIFVTNNLENVILDKITQLQDREKILREACINAVSLILYRIQQKGENSGGKNLGTYNNWYKKTRQQRGLQVSKIDLTFTGQMTQNFKVIPYLDNGYALGFDNEFASQKADWNEQRFGEIFQLTENEKMQIWEMILNRIRAILNL